MTTSSATLSAGAPRRYRFAPRDRAGLFLGLAATQCVLLAAGLLAAGALLQTTHQIGVALVPVAASALIAFGCWAQRPLHEWINPAVGWLMLRARHAHAWHMPVPLRVLARVPALPEFLIGVELRETPDRDTTTPRVRGMGVLVDRHTGQVSATLRVRGREFALLEPADQHRVLDTWGSALAGFCRERTPISRVTWTEWAAPASLDEHLAFVRDHHPADTAMLDRYVELVTDAGPLTTAHDVLITLTVDHARTRTRPTTRGQRERADDAAVDVLAEEIALFARRLDHAGLTVDGPLRPAELAHVVRLRLDPTCASRLARRATTLGEAAGAVSPHNWGPAATKVDWGAVQVDQSWHRSFWIAEWPRLEVPADWLAPVLLHAGGIRTFTVVYEPIPPSRSRRAVDRDATRLASDEDQRTRHGFRVRAQHRRAETDVLAREAELVAGYPELAYAGFLTITAPTPHVLEAETADWEQVAAQHGIELRALDGQHDLGLATALPIGRAPVIRRGILR